MSMIQRITEKTMIPNPKKQTQFKANFFKGQNERKRFFTKGL
jgi:hypothetical protein